MRIAHVVAYVSETGAFGGPVAVARIQTEALARSGHTVDLFAGWDGRARMVIPNVRVRLFKTVRASGHPAAVISPALVAGLVRRLGRYDVVHVHLGRDLVTAPVARIVVAARKPLIVQTHGMVMPSSKVISRVVDRTLVREVLRAARRCIVLTADEEVGIRRVSRRPVHIERLPNAIDRDPSIGQNASQVTTPTVVFISRLHPRKRVDLFCELAASCEVSEPSLRFEVYGPDEGTLQEVMTSERSLTNLCYKGPLAPSEVRDKLRKAAVLVLPSEGEVFPMIALESMSVGTPVVLPSDCGISADIQSTGAAVLTDRNADDILEAVRTLVFNHDRRQAVISSAYAALDDWLSIDKLTMRLASIYNGSN